MKNKDLLKEKIIDLQKELEEQFNLEIGELDCDFIPILNTLEYNF
jgi:hypothetical protein